MTRERIRREDRINSIITGTLLAMAVGVGLFVAAGALVGAWGGVVEIAKAINARQAAYAKERCGPALHHPKDWPGAPDWLRYP